jgi:hypothetical protein
VKNKKKLPLITLVRMARDAASGILHLHKVQTTSSSHSRAWNGGGERAGVH